MLIAGVVLSFAGALAATPLGATDCGDIERHVEVEVSRLSIARDVVGTFRGLGDEALGGATTCPGSTRLWYLAARAAEVLEIPLAGAGFADHGGARSIADAAVAHAPRSAPIATIVARLNGTTAAARHAFELDSRYVPARRALAIALAADGSTAQAFALLDTRDASSVGRLVRARLLLSAGRAREAEQEARRALRRPPTDPFEPLLPENEWRDGNEVLGLALVALNRIREARGPLQAAASLGSQRARRELDHIAAR